MVGCVLDSTQCATELFAYVCITTAALFFSCFSGCVSTTRNDKGGGRSFAPLKWLWLFTDTLFLFLNLDAFS
jgi:hypothetical protein